MQMTTFDRYENRQSELHQADPRLKVIVTLLFIISTVLLPNGAWLAFLATWGIILFLTGFAQLPLPRLLKRSLIIAPFMLAAATVLFTSTGAVLATWSLGAWNLEITDTGLIHFASIIVRSWLAVQMAIILTATTRFPDLIQALYQLRVPHLLVAIISFMYRYLFVLADEAARLLRARESRSAQLGVQRKTGGSLIWRGKVAGSMIAQLLLRSFERSDRVYQAMLSRGYNGRLHTLSPAITKTNDVLWIFASLAVMLLIQLVAYL